MSHVTTASATPTGRSTANAHAAPPAGAGDAVLMAVPSDGVPDTVDTQPGYLDYVRRLARGTGPVAVDTERASGFRYGQRAFLVQLRRDGAGTALVDPTALPVLDELAAALAPTEWILHAALQDLPCLHELGLRPAALFDTELAARLAGLPRVGLSAVTEQLLGVHLAKEHSAADWSTRPLPEDWRCYAALDVELLAELRTRLTALLDEQGKLAWALEEFEAERVHPDPVPRTDPWRRLHHLHTLRTPRQLAVARALWSERERMARHRDVAPGRLLPDAAIVAVAARPPRSVKALMATRGFTGRTARSHAPQWFAAIQAALQLDEDRLPSRHHRTDGPPPARTWKDRHPDRWARLEAAREAVAECAERIDVPAENLLTPDTLRRLCWDPPSDPTPGVVGDFLAEHGARPWQVERTAAALGAALAG